MTLLQEILRTTLVTFGPILAACLIGAICWAACLIGAICWAARHVK